MDNLNWLALAAISAGITNSEVPKQLDTGS
jgi:hypothetical protein